MGCEDIAVLFHEEHFILFVMLTSVLFISEHMLLMIIQTYPFNPSFMLPNWHAEFSHHRMWHLLVTGHSLSLRKEEEIFFRFVGEIRATRF